MKHQVIPALIATLFFACGGTDQTTVQLPDPGRPYTLPEVYPSTHESETTSGEPIVTGEIRVLDELHYGRETVTFLASGDADVLLQFMGYPEDDEVRAALEAKAAYRPTAAELWLTLSGEEPSDLPIELVRDHELTTLDRPDAQYQRLDLPEINKALTLRSLFTISPIGLPSCTDHSYLETVRLTNPSFAHRFLCSSSHPDTQSGTPFYSVMTGDVTTFPHICDDYAIRNNAFNSRSMRVAIYNNTRNENGGNLGLSISTRLCQGKRANQWDCTINHQAVLPGQYAAFEMVSAGVGFERFAVGVDQDNIRDVTNIPLISFGAGMQKAEPPQFGGPFCFGDTVPVP